VVAVCGALGAQHGSGFSPRDQSSVAIPVYRVVGIKTRHHTGATHVNEQTVRDLERTADGVDRRGFLKS
jgi:hypothetical protein